MLTKLGYGDVSLIRSRFQSVSGGAGYYDKDLLPGEPSFSEVYHDVWRIFFTPSQPVRRLIENEMKAMDLIPGDFAAAHLRALYGRITMETRLKETVVEWTRNALNCASQLLAGGPFLFASDHPYAIECAKSYGMEKQTKVVARKHQSRPIHIDKIPSIDYTASDFYDTFVDVLMIGMSRCVTFNRGGFGHWGLLIGYNASCFQNQKTSSQGIGVYCNWTKPLNRQESTKSQQGSMVAPLFLEPMDANTEVEVPNRRLLRSLEFSSLPNWMINYFAWHQETRFNLNQSNWNSTKYLVMICTRRCAKCGGISDRLKPLPFVVLQAYKSRRLLLIYWNKPASLEEYLIPPDGGVDWRVPDWLIPRLNIKTKLDVASHSDDLVRLIENGEAMPVVKARIQSPSAGEDYYTEQTGGNSTYQTVYHSLFRTFFTPSSRLAEKIHDLMDKHGLVPGEYASAHLRAMYGNRVWRDPRETIQITINAINCASQLYPGGPVYFAGDIKFAVEVAMAYSKQRHIPVAALEFNEDPLHLDKDDQWRTRDPSAYDETFLDLLLLGSSRCVAYSNGGYGTFGQLLSYDSNCTIRHFMRRKILTHCNWTHADGTLEKLEPPAIDVPQELLIKPA